ncbi:MAG: hypothetical protein AAGA75_23550 [Cyanobacteria bacterium P01_E01_bin.6]
MTDSPGRPLSLTQNYLTYPFDEDPNLLQPAIALASMIVPKRLRRLAAKLAGDFVLVVPEHRAITRQFTHPTLGEPLNNGR